MKVDPAAPELVAADFVSMANAAHVCLLLHDARTKNILWANPAACDLLEFSLDEIRPLKANHMSSSTQQYDRVIGRAWLDDAVQRGSSRIVWHYRSKSGRIIPTDALATRVELAQGPAVMVQFRDIEREQQIEQELKITTSYVDALARHTSTVAILLDSAGAVQFATDTALGYLGLTADLDPPEGIRITDHGLLRRDGRPTTWEQTRDAAQPVGPAQLVLFDDVHYPSWLEGSIERLRIPDVESYLMILHDVSERVRGEAARALELRRENHLARYNAMGDMAMAIAHELGQPLAAAGNFITGIHTRALRLVGTGELSPEVAKQMTYGLDNATRQVDRAAEIVSALRSFVGHLETVEQLVDLNEVVTECLYFIRLRAGVNDVDLEVRLSEEPIYVRCEQVLTGQVLMNLGFNAVDEMAACPLIEGSVVITTSVGSGTGVVTVSDRGRGFSRDPFEDSFSSKEGGSGIGLALSYRIITRQHGTIWARRRRGGGSTFGFALPLADAADVAESRCR